jgi:hypothetical protein
MKMPSKLVERLGKKLTHRSCAGWRELVFAGRSANHAFEKSWIIWLLLSDDNHGGRNTEAVESLIGATSLHFTSQVIFAQDPVEVVLVARCQISILVENYRYAARGRRGS